LRFVLEQVDKKKAADEAVVALAQVTFKIKVAHGGMLAQHEQRINSLWHKLHHLAVRGASMALSSRFPSVWLSSQ
jgi:hypothetical protein